MTSKIARHIKSDPMFFASSASAIAKGRANEADGATYVEGRPFWISIASLRHASTASGNMDGNRATTWMAARSTCTCTCTVDLHVDLVGH